MSNYKYNKVLAREYLLADGIVSAGSDKVVSIQELSLYEVLRGIIDMYGYEHFNRLLNDIDEDMSEESAAHDEAITMDEMVAKDPTIKDEWAEFTKMLDQEDLGDVDPSTYQHPSDDDCEGGGCKI